MARPQAASALERGLELAIATLLVTLVAWLGLAGWRFYDEHVLPQARAVPAPTPTPVVDPEVAREQARRMRQVLDHVGAGLTLKQAGRRDLAIREFQQALALDPGNAEARQGLAELGVQPAVAGPANSPVPPTPSPLPTFTPRPR